MNTFGNIGIGSTNPNAKLYISGSESTTNGSDAGLGIANIASGDVVPIPTASGSNNTWYIPTGATGTATPAGVFTIADNTGYRMTLTSVGDVVPIPTFLENSELRQEITDLKERLEKYTNNAGHKKYKASNKEKIQEYQKSKTSSWLLPISTSLSTPFAKTLVKLKA
jgi:hypothetical protein